MIEPSFSPFMISFQKSENEPICKIFKPDQSFSRRENERERDKYIVKDTSIEGGN